MKKQYNSDRFKKSKKFWLIVRTLSEAGLSPREIAEKTVNPYTGKNYTREHIYYVLKNKS